MSANRKRLINDPDRCVEESLRGFCLVNPGLAPLQGHPGVILRSDFEQVKKAGHTAILSGGGSGHEPALSGFVGRGFLTGCVCGAVFAAPPPSDVLAAIRATGKNNPGGAIIVFNNYTGDRLNFGIALERARSEGIKVDSVVCDDDCALVSKDKTAGRRGLIAILLVSKIGSAMAEEGKSYEEILNTMRIAAKSCGTLGICLSPCSVPANGIPLFQLGSDEVAIGLGLHGEPGVEVIKLKSAKEIVSSMVDHMTNSSNVAHVRVKSGDRVVLMINNLGSTTLIEMNIVAGEAITYLKQKGVHVERVYAGSFITSQEMAGVNICILLVTDEWLAALDSYTDATAWVKPLLGGNKQMCTPNSIPYHESEADPNQQSHAQKVSEENSQLISKLLSAACRALVESKDLLNRLDAAGGDGDCGSTLARGAKAILKMLDSDCACPLPVSCPCDLLLSLAGIAEQTMGGSSGGLYSLFFTSASRALHADTSAAAWSRALEYGIQAIVKYGGAEPGDRSMLDPLHSAFTILAKSLETLNPIASLEKATKAAEISAQETQNMEARVGRTSNVSRDFLTSPDPGAMAASIWLRAIHTACLSN